MGFSCPPGGWNWPIGGLPLSGAGIPAALTGAALVAAQTSLTAAQAAYADLVMGKSVVTFKDWNGSTVTYQGANIDKLSNYITGLIDAITPGLTVNGRRVNGPMAVLF